MRPASPAAPGLLLLLLLLRPAGAAKVPTPCRRCRELVDRFSQGMVNTAKKNFGGGNTAWEEKTLSKYEFSEIRLVEIMEGLCEGSDFECNRLVEEHEEQLETWWLGLKKEHPDLFKWFCVETLRVCCSPGTYGPDCLECQGGAQRPCSGNGHCRGDGSREGDGSCQCHMGYLGALCTECADGYFSSLRNETHSICTACNEACKTCRGPSSRDCAECEVGWVREEDACVDVDECSLAEKVCVRENENCYNTPGSFVCVCPEGFEDTEAACVQTAVGETKEELAPALAREDL
ncbi:protein disulfide isomerase CRELD2 isoform X2 [Choloepus didactylus]|uniref:protein disulfide isomerase CRELD2 isoform X2 n=1 Tax=Choloepus didactylus TaxID=27675 RepID=UPI00189F3FBB|nr:protein disulfide isomerase CRELD2 isoform X2 [Choloepus didactylus]